MPILASGHMVDSPTAAATLLSGCGRLGTKRLLGIYSGPGVDKYGLDNENPELPANVRRKLKPGENWIFADFEVCPLEPEKPGAMQAVCIESAKNIVVEK
jgi:hypothetical protein